MQEKNKKTYVKSIDFRHLVSYITYVERKKNSLKQIKQGVLPSKLTRKERKVWKRKLNFVLSADGKFRNCHVAGASAVIFADAEKRAVMRRI